ncbi:MAG TPA: hypothetical protein VLA49_13825 [Anaerolineales bacterium]|nr:hypothetical protein [Anaerolineales bacterium]
MQIDLKDGPVEVEMMILPGSERPARMAHELRSGERCPRCKRANLDYDGLLNLSCPECGYAVGGCFT